MKFLAAIIVVVALVAIHTEAAQFQCDPNVPYIENECNNCRCTETGVLGCTLKACLSPRNNELRNCVVGTSYEKECNRCECVKDMGTICTNKKC